MTDYHDLLGVTNDVGAANGIAGLDAAGKVAAAAVPDLSATYQVVSAKDAANGYAGLDANTRVPIAKLASGTPDGTKFVRDDNTLAVPAGTGTYAPLLFDSTLLGNAASIDTGSNGIAQTFDMLEVWALLRTTEAVVFSTALLTLNGDGGANYDNMLIQGVNATASASNVRGQTSWSSVAFGANAAAGAAIALHIVIPAYRQTTFHKMWNGLSAGAEATAANCVASHRSGRWRSTAAINQLKIAAGSGNLLAGSRLSIYGR